jgi:hypothetical protein
MAFNSFFGSFVGPVRGAIESCIRGGIFRDVERSQSAKGAGVSGALRQGPAMSVLAAAQWVTTWLKVEMGTPLLTSDE